jgi:fructose/tagatose bisphosphate aldolase
VKCATVRELLDRMGGTITLDGTGFFKVTDPTRFYKEQIDILALNASIGGSPEVVDAARWIMRMAALYLGSYPASIHELYLARGRGEVAEAFTVPAINIRGMTYDTARAAVRSVQKRDGGAFIFEIARSEIGYTRQSPAEFAGQVLAAAAREEFHGPVFIQGDHFQVNAKAYAENPEAEMETLRGLIREALAAGFFNIDIDASTLVDLSKPTLAEQQALNSRLTAELTAFIRHEQPEGVIVSVGGEIGEVGGQNSTVDELAAFMDGYNAHLATLGTGLAGLSKISVQSGTMHGGVVLADGSIADVQIDFDTLASLSAAARERYGLAGAVQHGASTLPDEAFDNFPRTGTAEIHLATAFQNIFFESLYMPDDLKESMYAWLHEHAAGDRTPDMSEEQFLYRTRKKAYGPFKDAIWDLDRGTRKSLSEDIEDRLDFLFERLGVDGTQSVVQKKVPPVAVHPPMPEALKAAL